MGLQANGQLKLEMITKLQTVITSRLQNCLQDESPVLLSAQNIVSRIGFQNHPTKLLTYSPHCMPHLKIEVLIFELLSEVPLWSIYTAQISLHILWLMSSNRSYLYRMFENIKIISADDQGMLAQPCEEIVQQLMTWNLRVKGKEDEKNFGQ